MVDAAVSGALADALGAATSASELVAVLWSWLDLNLDQLGSLSTKPSQIRAEVLALPAPTLSDAKNQAWLVAYSEDPVMHAARALATLEVALKAHGVAPEVGGAVPVPGVDGAPRLVLVRSRALIGGHDYPPAAVEQPSLYTLAPTLNVVPVSVHGIEVRVLGPPKEPPASTDWDELQNRLAMIQGDAPDTFCALLATLGDIGLTAEAPSHPTSEGTSVLEAMADVDEENACEAIAHAAAAAADMTVLLFPELCATPAMLASLQKVLGSLAAVGSGPAVTVVGLRHRYVGDEDGPSDQAGWVNEAIVLGPRGHELLRHRKLTAASSDGHCEDIKVGSELAVILTAVGGIAVLICLDVFAERVEQRVLAQPASLLCVPSCSNTVTPHRAAAVRIAQRAWGLVLVCNRWLDGRWEDLNVRSFAARAYHNEALDLVVRGTDFVFVPESHAPATGPD